MSKVRRFIRLLGPGLLYAGAAIGVSHLVQSTRAGAHYGLALVWAVVAANVFKYPFFEYGPRYALATGESLIEGYRRLGGWAFALFGALTVGTMFTIQAAVTMVTAGIAAYLFGGLSVVGWAVVLLGISVALLVLGGYAAIDRLMKYIVVILAVSTIGAVWLAASERGAALSWHQEWTLTPALLAFLIPLMGWMPAPFDLAVWHSVWALEKKRLHADLRLRDVLADFHVGYWGTTFLALCFVMLGALVVFPTGERLPAGAVAFAERLIAMYTEVLGGGAFIVIAVAAFTTMFSTTLTCLDAYGRVMPRILRQVRLPRPAAALGGRRLTWLVITAAGALALIFRAGSMRWMVDLATTLSFVTAPLWAALNLWLIRRLPPAYRPGPLNRAIAAVGLLFLTAFTVAYLRGVFS